MAIRQVVRMAALGVILAWLAAGCSASAREKTISATLTATNAAAAGFVAFDLKHQQSIVAAATDKASGQAALEGWRVQQLDAQKAFTAAYQAIATAATVNDDPSMAGMVAAAAQLSQLLKTLGVTP